MIWLEHYHYFWGRVLDLRQLRYVIAVAEERNITRAAEETGMLRPNFQTMLKKLGISVKDYFQK